MGVEKYTLAEGNGTDVPKKGDNCTLEYTGWLYDASAPNNKKGDPYAQRPHCEAPFGCILTIMLASIPLLAVPHSPPKLVLARSLKVFYCPQLLSFQDSWNCFFNKTNFRMG